MSEVDHIVPIAVDPTREHDHTNLQSLCDEHVREKNLADRKQYGFDG